jgi:hypothetical protein
MLLPDSGASQAPATRRLLSHDPPRTARGACLMATEKVAGFLARGVAPLLVGCASPRCYMQHRRPRWILAPCLRRDFGPRRTLVRRRVASGPKIAEHPTPRERSVLSLEIAAPGTPGIVPMCRMLRLRGPEVVPIAEYTISCVAPIRKRARDLRFFIRGAPTRDERWPGPIEQSVETQRRTASTATEQGK